jgi:transcriptional regulator GlxA family with amidase domain
MLWQIVVFDGFDELDVVAPFEVLRMAAARLANWNVELAALDGPRDFTANHGLRLHVASRLGPAAGPGRPDVVIIPGGGWISRKPTGARAEIKRGTLPKALAELYRAGTLPASVCTGAMLLAAAGLLKDRPAVTHHDALEDLRATGVQIIPARVVDAGDIVTAGGITSGLDLALHLVERFAGAALARELEHSLEYEGREEAWRPPPPEAA